jgi:kynureninase
MIAKEGDNIALVMFSGVQYYTAQAFDMKRITKAAHEKGCYVGFDLAHAVGNLELFLHDWEVDWACWCTYKYLNSGPGSIGGAFVHSKHNNNPKLKKLHGWWGQELANRFQMGPEIMPIAGAQSYQLSNPPVLPTVCLQASLEIFQEAKMKNLRAKSKIMTAYLQFLMQKEIGNNVKMLTPENPDARGCQISFLMPMPAKILQDELAKQNVIVDVRRPDVIRVSPAPLYNSFQDVYRFVKIFKPILTNCLKQHQQANSKL